jgi:cellulose synthase operon protein YhjQ
MTERRNAIATLYSRAHVEGARYWDFSASRQQVRGQFRRVVNQTTSLELPRPAAPAEVTSPRWYALQSILGHRAENVSEEMPETRPPWLLVVSLAGGVGKTCLVATLGRALSALGERVLLADTAECGLLPFYYGSRKVYPGVIRTFTPPCAASFAEADTPVQILHLESSADPLVEELFHEGRGAQRILLDMATANRELIRGALRGQPTVLVPVIPDMSSIASLPLLESLLSEAASVYYVLNQFDEAVPLHVDVRALLEEELGDRLLPVVLRRSFAVSEALAEGMTVMDYAPRGEAAEDYRKLAQWLRGLAVPAREGHRCARWKER